MPHAIPTLRRAARAPLAAALALGLAASALAAPPAAAGALPASDAEVSALLARRFAGDRTGACAVAAVIDGGRVVRGQACAGEARDVAGAAFEIGSVSKTMLGALLARLAADGTLSLDDPLARHLPEGAVVPDFEGRPITLRHLATHTAGLPPLPPGFAPRDGADPYASLDEAALLRGLADTRLAAAPGSAWSYSNFGAMLLSLAVSRAGGQPFDAQARAHLFAPLGMDGASIGADPGRAPPAAGHRASGEATPAWTFAPALAGVGGVRATLDDMTRYVQAQLGRGDAATVAMLRAGQAEQPVDARPMGLGWMIAPLGEARLWVHEGGTGGFSSLVAFDPASGRGVVVLADTALTDLGGLSTIGLPLLGADVPVGAPRVEQPAPAALLASLAGDYTLEGGLAMTLRVRGDALEIQATGQPAFAMGYDSAGHFFPRAFDALLVPGPDGRSFVWRQGGGAVPATRVPTAEEAAAQAAAGDAAPLDDYVGRYPLMPGFALDVRAEGGTLRAQATGQGAFALQPDGTDRFAAPAFGIVIRFERGDDGAVAALALEQGGQVLRGARQPAVSP